MSEVRAVLLDIDGTLVDSNDEHSSAWVDAFAEAGYTVPFERVRSLVGMGGDQLLPRVIDVREETPEGERISKRRAQIFRERYMPRVKPFPQARELVQRMKAEGLRVVVAISGSPEDARPLLELAGVADLLDGETNASDAERSKPSPDIVQAAIGRCRCGAAEIVMLGDTPYDVQAATKAGVRIVALRCGGWTDTDLTGAVAVYDDPADLLAHFDESPFSPRAARTEAA